MYLPCKLTRDLGPQPITHLPTMCQWLMGTGPAGWRKQGHGMRATTPLLHSELTVEVSLRQLQVWLRAEQGLGRGPRSLPGL